MQSRRVFFIAVAVLAEAHIGSAQNLSLYRNYSLDSSVAAVVAASGVRASDVRTLHERPALMQEIEWRMGYVTSGSEMADPVRRIVFGFYNDALYQIVVTYDHGRTDGLTSADLIKSLSAVYGEPLIGPKKTRPAGAAAGTIVVAQWDNAVSSMTLVRGLYTPEYQVFFVSKALIAKALAASQEAARLDLVEAPRRYLELQKKNAAEAAAARDKTRTTNKAAFRP